MNESVVIKNSEKVHFLTLHRMFSSISLKKTEKNVQTMLLQPELENYGIRVKFFWSPLELYTYLETQPLSDHIFLDEFSLSLPSKVN
jgi:hypothetical protein